MINLDCFPTISRRDRAILLGLVRQTPAQFAVSNKAGALVFTGGFIDGPTQ